MSMSVEIPEEMNDQLEQLVDAGLYSNKSELVRDAIRRRVIPGSDQRIRQIVNDELDKRLHSQTGDT